jgi:hypothetical protein
MFIPQYCPIPLANALVVNMALFPMKIWRYFFSLTLNHSTIEEDKTVSLVAGKKNEKRAIYQSLWGEKELILWGVWISSTD